MILRNMLMKQLRYPPKQIRLDEIKSKDWYLYVEAYIIAVNNKYN